MIFLFNKKSSIYIMAFCFILTLINSLLNNCVHRNKKAPPNGSALKWAQQGSNLRPPDYESGALTN